MSNRLTWAMGLTFLVALLYPLSIVANLGADGIRWIQNDPAYSVFVLFILPLAVGIFARIFDPRLVRRVAQPLRSILLGLLVVMQLLAAMLSSQEVFRLPVPPPILLGEPAQAQAVDDCLRHCVHPERDGTAAVCDDPACQAVAERHRTLTAAEPGADWGAVAAEVYRDGAGITPFASYADLVQRASLTVFVGGFFDVFAGALVMLLMWYVLVLVCARESRDPAVIDGVIVIYGLLLLWFPTRLYSEWYLNFYSVAHFSDYFAFWTLMVVALVFIPLLVLLLKPGRPVFIFTAVNSAVLSVLGLTNYFKPAWVLAVADAIERMPFVYFIALVLLLVVVLGAMVFAMLPGQAREA